MHTRFMHTRFMSASVVEAGRLLESEEREREIYIYRERFMRASCLPAAVVKS